MFKTWQGWAKRRAFVLSHATCVRLWISFGANALGEWRLYKMVFYLQAALFFSLRGSDCA
jgi:hypothetical protein